MELGVCSSTVCLVANWFSLLYIQSREKYFQKERIDKGMSAAGRSHGTRSEERPAGFAVRSFLIFAF